MAWLSFASCMQLTVLSSTQGSLVQVVPHAVLDEVNNGMKDKSEKQMRKRGLYLSSTAKEKLHVAKHGSSYRVCAVVKCFSKGIGKDLNENTVRIWVKAYNKELRRKCSLTEIRGNLVTWSHHEHKNHDFFF